MKIKNMIFVVAAIAATACTKEIVSENGNTNQPEVKLYPMTFTAGSDDGSEPESKVTLEGKKVLWASDDQIKVFDGTSNNLQAFSITDGAGTTKATFSGNVSVPNTKTYYAMYPYQEAATYNTDNLTIGDNVYPGGYFTLDLPEFQTAVEGSVDPKAFITVAKSDTEGNFSFKNLVGLIKFKIKEEYINNLESITIYGQDGESISGNMKVGFNEKGIPVQTYVSGTMDTFVTLSAPEDGFKANTEYFFAIRSCKFEKGFNIVAKYSDGTYKHISTNKGPNAYINRDNTLNLKEIPTMKAGLPNDLYLAYRAGLDINIAGNIVNKTKYRSATLVTAAKTISGTTGVFFINNDINVTITQNEMNQAAFIGRYNDKRSAVTITKQIQPKSSGSDEETIIIKNLDINYTPNSQFIVLKSDFANLAIDNCAIKYLQHTLIHAATYKCANVSIENSEIGFTMNTAESATEASTPIRTAMYLLYADQNKENTNTTSINFNNNIVYYKSTELLKNPTDFKIVHGKTNIDNISVDKNTFINTSIPNAGLIRFTTLTNSCKVTSNIFEECNISGVKSWILQNASVTASGDISNNYYYTNTTGTLKIIGSAVNIPNITTKNDPVKSENRLLSDWDFENGIFGTYKLPDGVTGVGATR